MDVTILLVFFFAIAYLGTGEERYNAPLKTCIEAEYQNSEAKRIAEGFVDKAKNTFPKIALVGPAVYGIAIRRQARFSSSRFSIPGSVGTYNYDRNSFRLQFTWSF